MQPFHPRKGFIASALLIAVLLLAIIFLMPSSVPVAHATGPSLFTSLTLQNLDPSLPMNAKLTYFNANGQSVLSTFNTVQPYRSITINQPIQIGLPTDFAGNATLDSDTPFGAVVVEYNGTTAALGKNFFMDGYTAWSGTDASTNIALPQLLKNIYDSGTTLTFNSSLSIQNTSSSSANVTIAYYQSTGQTYTHSGIVIPPGGSYTANQQNDPAFANLSSFYGCGRVTSDQPVVVVAHYNTANSLASVSGASNARAATTLYVPQLIKNIYDPPSSKPHPPSTQPGLPTNDAGSTVLFSDIPLRAGAIEYNGNANPLSKIS